MKKSKFFLIMTTMFGALVSFLVVFQLLKDHFDDCKEEDLFEDDTDLDFIDENISEEPESSIKEEKPEKAAQKVRRGYIPIKLHTSEAAN